ncbi:MAG: TSUP family transporter [Nitrospiraceae bacterium]|nr:TSUP family transporter [Nitrospiraceae bacterium]
MQHLVITLSFGAITGFILGLLGGGGSIITIPILVYAVGLDVHSAIGTSLVIVGANALMGAAVYAHRGEVRIKGGIIFGSMSMVGAIPGAFSSNLFSGKILLLLFSALMVAVAINMMRRNCCVAKNAKQTCNHLRLALLGVGVGFLTGFFGVGGGFLIVPALIMFEKFPAREAIGTSLLIISMASFSGLVAHAHVGSVDFGIAGLFILGGLAGSIAGISFSRKIDESAITRTFGWFLIAIALYIIYRSIA